MLLCDALIHYYLTIAHLLQVPPSAHHIIYLITFSATFIRHPVFVLLLEISVDNGQIHLLCKIFNHRSFLISRSSIAPFHYFLIPMFPSPTCPFRSTPRIIPSCLISINQSRSFQKSFFSSVRLLTCGAYAFTIFSLSTLFAFSFIVISFITPSLPQGNFQPAPPSPLSLSHFFFHHLHSIQPIPMFLALLSFHFISCRHSIRGIYIPSLHYVFHAAFSPFQSLFQYLRYHPTNAPRRIHVVRL